ncbi:FKBP-type peptidyl-prolyl cis-trans isomerase [Nocardioides sp. AE5]|uniref:FKBP-type peptidyl-prolyl cis-trans isomerase n=1 Tax=Nocardioides sp. AE5 TaxID=2962573 RepID=UPI002881F2C0|nr:FKBP-type peptidyl-prolyl cis-trans isomerase [Nocardioides sp. AE5]MDT0203557.1 FKBP-type peptidyl-prolyl cis-trans isomerase [Nocardioides sp. AE5]
MLTLLATITLLLLGLTACSGGDDETPDSGTVNVTGEAGAEPQVELEGTYHRNGLTSDVLVEGDGETVGQGSNVFVRMLMVNAYDGEVAFSSWRNGNQEFLTLDDSLPGLTEALINHKVGSRVVIEGNGRNVFGDFGQPSFFISPGDSIVIVADIMSEIPDLVDADADAAPAGEPKVVLSDDGRPNALDFTDLPTEMPTEARVVSLTEGDGPALTEESVMVMRYVGQVWGAEEPFQESFSRPLTADDVRPLTGYVSGYLANLPGVKVGSRILLVLPPAQGYGEEGNPDAGIEGTDTIVFLIDVLAAYEPTEPVVPEGEEPTEEPSATDPSASATQ